MSKSANAASVHLPDKMILPNGKLFIDLSEVHWLNPAILVENPLSCELFGEKRLVNLGDLLKSLELGFDPSRPISVVLRNERDLVVIDGHRRRRAAMILGITTVPLVLISPDGAAAEREEMIRSNLVRNRKHSTVPIGTAVKLIQEIKPRDVKRGRPLGGTKKTVAQGASNETDRSPDSKRKYYAGLLNISTKRFRYADYVLRHGNDEEKRELDTGPRSLTTIYEAVHARVNNLAESSALDPNQICSLTRSAARSAIKVIAESGIQPHTDETSVEERLDALAKQARQESAGALPRGTTLENALELLAQIFTGWTSLPSDKDGRINEQKPNQTIADNEAAHALPQTSDFANTA